MTYRDGRVHEEPVLSQTGEGHPQSCVAEPPPPYGGGTTSRGRSSTRDPIIAEIHRYREEFARRFNYDLHAMMEYLRREQASNPDLVDLSKRRAAKGTRVAETEEPDGGDSSVREEG